MCWVQTAAGHSVGDGSISSVRTTRAPAARQHRAQETAAPQAGTGPLQSMAQGWQ